MKGSDYIARFLEAQGVRQVFEVVGGMVTHLVDSIHQRGRIRLVSVHHEQAAAFAADAVGRMSGVPGVAMATSGPGATNLLTGIGSCYFDSTPALFITGQVNRNEQKGSRPIRQLGFQETDIVSMAAPIVKGAWKVEQPESLPEMLRNALSLALSGRPGPVLLDIPMDVQRAEVRAEAPARLAPRPAGPTDATAVQALLRDLERSRRPLLLAGGGIRSARAGTLFRQILETVRVPVVNSLMAVDCLPYGHPLRFGMIGSYGNRWANLALGAADFLLVLGSRLDVRQTGSETQSFKGDRTIYHVDCEMGEVNNRVTGCRAVISDLRPFLETLQTQSLRSGLPDWNEWKAEIGQLRESWPDTAELREVDGINPNAFMHHLAASSRAASAFVVDVGQHQMWAAQSLELEPDQRFLTSGGMGAMGFALPAAVGASIAEPDRPVVVIAGDGGFQLNTQELQTVVRNRLPLKIVVLNNRCYGMVRQFQQSYFHGRYPSTYLGYSAPDFERVANGYGIAAKTIAAAAQIDGGLADLWNAPATPFLLQVMIDTFANAYPKLAFGRPITEMEPFATPLEMEGT